MSPISMILQMMKNRPPLDLCGSRLYKIWYRYAYHSYYRGLANLIALAFLLFCGVPLIFAWFALPKPLAILVLVCYVLFVEVIRYDFDILQCLYNENSEYYRATGVTKEDVLKDKGIAGEFKAYILSKKLRVPHKTLYNLCIPMPNGSFQEVDAVIITQGHLYVLECKNRAGIFEGAIDSEFWLQHIGNQEHDVQNIFLQNREHVFAIEHFLKSKELVPLHFMGCNMLLTGEDFSIQLNSKQTSAIWAWGNVDWIAKEIIREEKSEPFEDLDEKFMDNVYAALLPYALNKQGKKDYMLQEREEMSLNKTSARGPYRYFHLDSVPWVNDKESVIRQDAIYTQIMLRFGGEEYIPEWLILPHIRYIEEYTTHKAADDESDASEDVYLTEEQKIMKEKMLEQLSQTERYHSTRPMIEEGYEYFVHHVPVEKYWERFDQISKPAEEDVIKEYLQVRDDAPLTAEKQALQLSAVVAVIMVSLIGIFM